MSACPLAAHALPRTEAEALLASHPEPRKRKLDAFMAAEPFGVSAPLGKKPHAVPLYRAAAAATSGYEMEPGSSSGGAHKRVHMGFYIAGEGNGNEAAGGSGTSGEAGGSSSGEAAGSSSGEAAGSSGGEAGEAGSSGVEAGGVGAANENMDELD